MTKPNEPTDEQIRRDSQARTAAEQAATTHLAYNYGDGNDADPMGSASDLVELVANAAFAHRHGGDTDLPDPGVEEVLAALRLVWMARAVLDNNEREIIAAARERGLTWKQIAEARGWDSPQAAAQRYARLGGSDAA